MTDKGLQVNISSMRYPGPDAAGNLIEDLSFSAAPQSVVSLLGRSGAGKTTLLRIIAGLERRYVGEVTLGLNPILRPSRDTQIVFQDYRLLPWKTVYKNIEFATDRSIGPLPNDQIERWLKIIGLKEKRNAWPKTLSGGEEGRVAFARAFVAPPKVLLLDEPFRNLDFNSKFDLQDNLIAALRAQATIVILVSHSVDDAVYLSDTVHLLSHRPMRIEASFSISTPRPRQRGDDALSEISARITRYLASKPSN